MGGSNSPSARQSVGDTVELAGGRAVGCNGIDPMVGSPDMYFYYAAPGGNGNGKQEASV